MKLTDFDKNMVIDTDIKKDDFVWLDAKDVPFSLHGVHYAEDEQGYVRIDAETGKGISSGVDYLRRHTAGGRVRFRTDSPYIAIRAVQQNDGPMSHMPLTGQSGFDLYRDTGDGRGELYYTTFRPPMGVKNGFSSWADTDSADAEYTINFPLYDFVGELYIGLQKDSSIDSPKPYKIQKPVVYYGSSITQGGCASRPGNAYQAILSRLLDCDHVNLGFSGSAKGEQAMADYISTLDMSVFVCDFDHNASGVEELSRVHLPFLRRIREKQPELPIIIISAPDVLLKTKGFGPRREIIRKNYETLVSEGDKNVYFIDGGELFAGDCWDSCTVDGAHPNDLGFYRMARRIEKTLTPLLK